MRATSSLSLKTVPHLCLGNYDDDGYGDDDDDDDDDDEPEQPSQRKAISPPSIESQIIRGR